MKSQNRPQENISATTTPAPVPGGSRDTGAGGGLLDIKPENIPARLHSPCVAWRGIRKTKPDGSTKWDKVPVNPHTGRNASTAEASTWGSLAEALAWRAAAQQSPGGVGYVFTGAGLVGIDLDGCFDSEGEIHPDANEIVQSLGSYTELSPTGTGLHIIVDAALPGVTSEKCAPGVAFPFGIEFFHDRYFLTLTGHTPDDAGLMNVQSRQAELDALFRRVQAAKTATAKPADEVDKFERDVIATLADLKPSKRTPYTGTDGRAGFKWTLGRCINAADHTTGDGGAAVFLFPGSGAGYTCQHSHCTHIQWPEFAKARGLRWDRRALTSGTNGKSGGRPPMDPARMAADFVEATREAYEIRVHRGVWYEFAKARGWTEIAEDEIEKRVMTFLANHPEHAAHARTNAVREVLAHLATFTMNAVPAEIELPARLHRNASGEWTGTPCPNEIAFKTANGYECRDLWATAEWIACLRDAPPEPRPADATFFSLDWMPYEYRPDLVTQGEPDLAALAPAFARYIEFALDARERDALRRMYGLALVDVTKYEAFWFLFGRTGREGKTVSLDVLKGLLGRPSAISYVDLAKLGDRFQAWPLAHSKVNLCGDTNSVEGGELRKIEGLFKDLVSGGGFEYERKNDNKRVARCRSRFIFAGNTLPEFMDRSDAIWERLRIINFPRAVPEGRRDPDLAARIVRDELPAVLGWALLGLAEVIAQARVEDTPTGRELKTELRRVCDHEAAFLEDSGYERTPDPECTVSSSTLYSDYATWADANGYKRLGSAKFIARVCTLLRVRHKIGKNKTTRKSERVIEGLTKRPTT